MTNLSSYNPVVHNAESALALGMLNILKWFGGSRALAVVSATVLPANFDLRLVTTVLDLTLIFWKLSTPK